MYSMTGYGRSTVEREGRTLTIELKSVNHRFLDLSFRMPRQLACAEDALRKRLNEKLARGHVDVMASYRNMRADARRVLVDPALAAAYTDAFTRLSEATGLSQMPTLADIGRYPDVLVVSEAEEDTDALIALALDTLDIAVENLKLARASEGERMKNDLAARVDALDGINESIIARYPGTIADYEARLRARIQELLSGAEIDETRLVQEVALMADRSAVDEETVRLKSHFAQLREVLASDQPAGRKLDFIVQELNREFNTISSKSQDVAITRLVVEAKSEVEKLREQVQNVE